jgi:Uma2 family endonuclease
MAATVPGLAITEDYLLRLTRANPGWQFERSSKGELLVSPTTSLNGPRNVALSVQLSAWNARSKFGKVFDSSSGFTMPDGAILSPDGSCVRRDRWDALTPEQHDSYAPLCPDVCIEIASKTDSWAKVREKIERYVVYGAQYALAINPTTRQTFELGSSPESLALDIDAIIDA